MTLYDEIQYTGNPSSFAWVLPIAGQVTVGLSSDALFNQIDQITTVTVSPPDVFCNNEESASASGSSGGGDFDAGGVTVVSQAVVGPYQTVQLSSTDPNALSNWLATNGYNIPSDIQPVISAYVSAGFDFLALKLVPGAGVSAMQPVRVTTPGASPVLPLRMVAAGVPPTVPITLFVVGEGRYAPTNFPAFTIDPSKLVWDFDTERSNYLTLEQQAFTAAPSGWLVQYAEPTSEDAINGPITELAQYNPTQSGYADSMGNGAPAAAMADLDTLFSGIDATSLWVTRMFAQMPRTALSQDLTLGASSSQTPVSNFLTAPMYVNCAGMSSGQTGSGGAGSTGVTSGTGASSGTGTTSGHGATAGSGATGGSGGANGAGGSSSGEKSSSSASCAVSGEGGAPLALGAVLGALGLAFTRRRRAPRR